LRQLEKTERTEIPVEQHRLLREFIVCGMPNIFDGVTLHDVKMHVDDDLEENLNIFDVIEFRNVGRSPAIEIHVLFKSCLSGCFPKKFLIF